MVRFNKKSSLRVTTFSFPWIRRSCKGLQNIRLPVWWKRTVPAVGELPVSISSLVWTMICVVLCVSRRRLGFTSSSLCRNICTSWCWRHWRSNGFVTHVLAVLVIGFGESRQSWWCIGGWQSVRGVAKIGVQGQFWRWFRTTGFLLSSVLMKENPSWRRWLSFLSFPPPFVFWSIGACSCLLLLGRAVLDSCKVLCLEGWAGEVFLCMGSQIVT